MTNGRRSDVLTIARAVLRRRGSDRIIEIASARGDVRNLLNEYRQYMNEAERLLQRHGIRISAAALEFLRDEWADTLIEHQRQALPLRA